MLIVRVSVPPSNEEPAAGKRQAFKRKLCSIGRIDDAFRKGPWVLSNAKPLKVVLSNRFFAEKGLLFLLDLYEPKVTTT
jgi:hypothetical protein